VGTLKNSKRSQKHMRLYRTHRKELRTINLEKMMVKKGQDHKRKISMKQCLEEKRMVQKKQNL